MGKWRHSKNNPMPRIRERDKSVAFLLGAGFSKPKGYPIGNCLNNKLLKCQVSTSEFSSSGELIDIKANRTQRTIYDCYFDFCIDTIQYYNNTNRYGTFDYEEFYDYLKEKANNDVVLKQLFDNSNYIKNSVENFEHYLSQMDIIYNQLVDFFLKDKDGNSWYENEPFHCKPKFDGYTGFLNCMEQLLEKRYTINVHTLNHDLFFERLNNTEWINGTLYDGFEETDSPFHGKLPDGTKCKLARYTGNYNSKLRLYKLHGSKDYYVYYTNNNNTHITPDNYIKSKSGICTTEFYKEIEDNNGNITYENCFNNYHPDFLTGKESKIERYKEPLLYQNLFKQFKKNLYDAEKLIIIGYGCGDKKINEYIIDEFGKKKPCYFVDPCAKEGVIDLIDKIGNNAHLIQNQINDLQLSDFDL
jgi:hypothetical protein